MNQSIIIIALIFLSLGVLGIFLGKEILVKMNIIKTDSGYDTMIRTTGFVVSIISLAVIYFIGR